MRSEGTSIHEGRLRADPKVLAWCIGSQQSCQNGRKDQKGQGG